MKAALLLNNTIYRPFFKIFGPPWCPPRQCCDGGVPDPHNRIEIRLLFLRCISDRTSRLLAFESSLAVRIRSFFFRFCWHFKAGHFITLALYALRLFSYTGHSLVG